MKILLWLVLVPIILIALLFLLSFISQRRRHQITKAEKILLRKAFGKNVMPGCYLTSVAWSDMPEGIKNYSEKEERRYPLLAPKKESVVRPCPLCGLNPEELVWIEYSPIWVGRGLCGQCGYLSICPCCKKAVSKIVTIISHRSL